MAKNDLTLVSTTEPDWFHLIDAATDAIKFKLRSNDAGGVWDVFERAEAGFCFRGQCVGARPSEAFRGYMKKQNAEFMMHVRAEF